MDIQTVNDNDINQMIGKVKAFMNISGQAIGVPSKSHTWGLVDLRIGLLESEITELDDAIHTDNMNLIVDGLGDILYVAFGNMLTFIGDEQYKMCFKHGVVTKPNGILPHYMEGYRIVRDLRRVCEFDEGYQLSDYETYYKLITRIFQFAYEHGIDIVGAFNEVHDSNMTKFCYNETESCASIIRYKANGITTHSEYNNEHSVYVIKNSETGKVLKGIRFREPDLTPYY